MIQKFLVKSKRDIEKRRDDGRMSDMLRQLAMYSYLLAGNGESRSVSASRLLFLEAPEGDKESVYETRIGAEEIALLKKDISDFDQHLQKGDWVDLPCDFKPFGSQKECPYCALANSLK